MNKDFDSYLDSFLDYLLYELNYSHKTISTYKYNILEYKTFLGIYKYSYIYITNKEALIYKS